MSSPFGSWVVSTDTKGITPVFCFLSGHVQNRPRLANTKSSLAHIKSSLKIIFLNKPITKGRLFFFFFLMLYFRGKTERGKDLYAFFSFLKKRNIFLELSLGNTIAAPFITPCSVAICRLPLHFLLRIPLSSLTCITAPGGFPSSSPREPAILNGAQLS